MKCLNFGAGEDRRYNWDNADLDNHLGANICFDFNVFPYPIKDNTYDYILANHTLEHLRFPEETINELCRVIKPNGILQINVPHMNSEGAFCLGHINFWNERSFIHLENPDGVNNWKPLSNFKIKILELIIIPSTFGKWIPTKWLRRKVSLMLRGIYNHLEVKMQVLK